MVINIRLVERVPMGEEYDSLGRDWYGYDPAVSPDTLWAHNRGRWSLKAAAIDNERWVAFNYQSHVVLVAELTGDMHETVADDQPGRFKKALIGRPLGPGHPVHDALIGSFVDYVRNPSTYGPDPDISDSVLERFESASGPDDSDKADANGQGLLLDAQRRKLIEDAAQARLMRHFELDGWDVEDTHLNRPYDAVARRKGEVAYLEAKGTQSRGESVIVTRNEVAHARVHQGATVIGIWSGMRIVGDEVDPSAGQFSVMAFDPDAGDLEARDYDWSPPTWSP